MTTQSTIVGEIEDEVLRFTVGRDPELDVALAEADCLGTAAHVTMLSRVPVSPRLLTAAEARRVIRVLTAVIKEVRAGRFRISNRDQDVHLAVERVLTRKLAETGKKVHTGRSRNDQVAVDLRLYGKTNLLDLMTAVLDLADVLLTFAERHAAVPMVGRTHLQPAMPSSVGLWGSAYAESLLDDMILLQAVYAMNNKSPLGSAAGYGVGLPIDRKLTARLLGFAAPVHNVLHAANARGKCESAVLAALGQVMLTLSRLAEDLILYSMPEFDYFRLPAAVCTGSSIMPQKKNPDVLELVRARTVRVQGAAATAAGIVARLPGGYQRDLQEIKGLYVEGMGTVRDAVGIMATVLRRVWVNRKALRAAFGPEVFATDRTLELVAEGKPFRDAYRNVKAHLKDLENRSADEAVREKRHLGAPGELDLDVLRLGAARFRDVLVKERRAFHGALSKLLGVKYPELTRRR
ncbi:MAG: argininosuccinate lyase [Lentisphaerae bacterium]|nr:argininosuccinate lyase [Lentisphaerota bacterium]